MSISPQSSSFNPSRNYASTRKAALRRIFIGDQDLRAGWSALLFVAIVVLLNIIIKRVERHFIPVLPKGPVSFGLGFLDESLLLFMVLTATAVMARIEGRRLVTYGFGGSHRLIRLVCGMGWGFLALSILVGVLWKSGLLAFDGLMLSGFVAWRYAFAWGLGFLVVDESSQGSGCHSPKRLTAVR